MAEGDRCECGGAIEGTGIAWVVGSRLPGEPLPDVEWRGGRCDSCGRTYRRGMADDSTWQSIDDD